MIYLSKTILNILLTLFLLCITIVYAIGLFTNTFYDTKISECNDTEIQNTLYYQKYKKEMKCWSKR